MLSSPQSSSCFRGNGQTSEGNLKVKDMISVGEQWKTDAMSTLNMWIVSIESEDWGFWEIQTDFKCKVRNVEGLYLRAVFQTRHAAQERGNREQLITVALLSWLKNAKIKTLIIKGVFTNLIWCNPPLPPPVFVTPSAYGSFNWAHRRPLSKHFIHPDLQPLLFTPSSPVVQYVK